MSAENSFRHLTNPFLSSTIAMQPLMDYTTAHLVALVSVSPGPEFAARVTATNAAANALNASMAETGNKLAMQKMQTEIKKAFRGSLPGQILEIYGAIVGAAGASSPILTECFPLGRSVFGSCKDGELDDQLQMLVTAIGHHGSALPPAAGTKAGTLLETWNGIYEAASSAKGTKKMSAVSRQDLRGALAGELYRNLLMLGLQYLDDPDKAAAYCPKYLLEGRATPETPGATTLTLAGQDAQPRTAHFTMTADGAESFRLLRRVTGETDMTVVAEGIVPVNGVGTFSIYLEGTATYEFAAEAVRGPRTGERSGSVSVAAN